MLHILALHCVYCTPLRKSAPFEMKDVLFKNYIGIACYLHYEIHAFLQTDRERRGDLRSRGRLHKLDQGCSWKADLWLSALNKTASRVFGLFDIIWRDNNKSNLLRKPKLKITSRRGSTCSRPLAGRTDRVPPSVGCMEMASAGELRWKSDIWHAIWYYLNII